MTIKFAKGQWYYFNNVSGDDGSVMCLKDDDQDNLTLGDRFTEFTKISLQDAVNEFELVGYAGTNDEGEIDHIEYGLDYEDLVYCNYDEMSK